MLKRNITIGQTVPLQGFILAAEVEEGTDLDAVANRLAEGIQFMEGVGKVEVTYLGQLEEFEEDETETEVGGTI